MTDAQTDALDRANELLGEHFDCYVIVSAEENPIGEQMQCTYGGGFYRALGILSAAYHGAMKDVAVGWTEE